MSSRRSTTTTGTHDGADAADHDQPYRFRRPPTISVPYPFNPRLYLRLLVVRGHVQRVVAA